LTNNDLMIQCIILWLGSNLNAYMLQVLISITQDINKWLRSAGKAT